ncbi:MAG TPA: DUF559 domain-containing protein [Methanofastidiosum sp.]|nr:DUF559 domain-containing protein [Methanofastidiosum sp.]
MSDIKWKQEEFELLWKDKDSWKQEDGSYICQLCNQMFSKYGIKNHLKNAHFNYILPEYIRKKISWNRGLTKETDERVKKTVETYYKKIKEGQIIPYFTGKKLSNEHKKKISTALKVAHKENRAWNIGKSRWNNKLSYPEIFFVKIIENEFTDKNYIHEYPFKIYSLDFAWPHLKKCIEIDGDQHYKFEEQIKSDKRKDRALEDEGWKVLRIRWKDMMNDTKTWIKVANDFILA